MKFWKENQELALINEQAFSAGTVDVLKKAKFKAIIMDWNNSYKLHPDWNAEFAYLPQVALGTSEESLPLLWNNSIFFKSFKDMFMEKSKSMTF